MVAQSLERGFQTPHINYQFVFQREKGLSFPPCAELAARPLRPKRARAGLLRLRLGDWGSFQRLLKIV